MSQFKKGDKVVILGSGFSTRYLGDKGVVQHHDPEMETVTLKVSPKVKKEGILTLPECFVVKRGDYARKYLYDLVDHLTINDLYYDTKDHLDNYVSKRVEECFPNIPKEVKEDIKEEFYFRALTSALEGTPFEKFLT